MALSNPEKDSMARKLYELVQEGTRKPELDDLRAHLVDSYADLSPVETDEILEYAMDIIEGRCSVPPFNAVDMEAMMGDRGTTPT